MQHRPATRGPFGLRPSVCLFAASLAATLAAPAAMAQSSTSGHARAVIDWTSVHVAAGSGSDFSVFDTYAGVYSYTGLNTPQPVIRSAVDNGSLYPMLAVADAGSTGARSYSLQSTLDLAHAQIQFSDVASSNSGAGPHLDEATASRWIYVIPSGNATLNLQGDCFLHLAGNAVGFDSSTLSASVGVVVYSEVLGKTYLNDQFALNDSVTAASPGGAISAGSYQHFDETVRLLAGEIYRLEFDTTASVDGFSTPVPEPGSAALLLIGLPALGALIRRRPAAPFRADRPS